MPGRRPIIMQSDVTRILKGAKAAGITLSIVVKGDEVRFVQSSREEVEGNAIEKWRAARNLEREQDRWLSKLK